MLSDVDRATLRELLAFRERAAAEVARLSVPDDLGSGERTGRLANLGSWETEAARLDALLLATAGERVRAADGGVDLDQIRRLIEVGE